MALYNLPIRTITIHWQSAGMYVPALQRDVSVQLLSDDWPASPDGRTLTIQLDQSFDGGATWQHWVGITCAVGGRARNGNLPYFGITLDGIARQARVSITPSATIRLGVDVTVMA